MIRASSPTPASARMLATAVAALVLAGGFLLSPSSAEVPTVTFDENGPANLKWNGQQFLGPQGFAVQNVVFEDRGAPAGPLWGYEYTEAQTDNPKVEADPGERRITHQYDWGRAALTYRTEEDCVKLDLQLTNTSQQAIADFRVRLADIDFGKSQPQLKNGLAYMTLDRPVSIKGTLPRKKGSLFTLCETIAPPVQFGFKPFAGNRHATYALFAQGGVPAPEPNSPTIPVHGVPRIQPDETLRLTFALRFAPHERPDSEVLRPFQQEYLEAQTPRLDWPDRRPLGKLVLPSNPRYITPENPRGWFKTPSMDTSTEEGRAELRKKLVDLADRAVANLEKAGAQGVIVHNIEGGHSYPDVPFGDPRRLEDIAPEMDASADVLFERFREAGLRVGVTIRPSLVHYSERRQRWTHNSGEYMPDHEELAIEGVDPDDVEAGLVYPVVERMDKIIQYAKDRWDCSLFTVHDNGFWWQAAANRPEDWFLVSAGILGELRERHPDVLLIPRYAERNWRSARANVIRNSKDNYLVYNDSLRGIDEHRVGDVGTPEWVLGNAYRYRHVQRMRGNVIPPPDHVLHEAYWAHSAPYVELKLKREIRDYVLTLEQHMEYTREQAEEMAEKEVAFETTPPNVREWISDAFCVTDIHGAKTDLRRAELVRAAAWGDILMWRADQDPTSVAEITEAGQAKKQRMAALAEYVGANNSEADGSPPALSLIWRHGTPVDVGALVADRPVPANLRARVTYSPDRKRALLMLAWRGETAHTVQLNPNLPGIEIDAPHRDVWLMPAGNRASADRTISVEADAFAGLNALLIQGATEQGASPPPGVLFAASFDEGVQPDMGAGVRRDDKYRKCALVDGRAGKAAQLGDGGEVRFNVVPKWYAGGIEFDLNSQQIGAEPLPVLSLRHHLDLDLTLEKRNGRVGIALEARERELKGDQPPDAVGGQTDRQTAFAHLPAGTGGWSHVLLTWELGQYVIYIDGKRAAEAFAPVRPARRDAAILEPGVILGGKKAKGKALVDSLIAYDWHIPEEKAARRRVQSELDPIPLDAKRRMNVWLWGSFPEKVRVGINARTVPGWSKASAFRVSLFEKLDAGKQRVGDREFGAYGGVSVGELPFKRDKSMEASNEITMDDSAHSAGDEDGLDELEELGEELEADKAYILEVTPLPEKEAIEARTFDFKAGADGIPNHRW